MTKKEFLALFEEIVEEAPGALTGIEDLNESVAGWNSLAVVSLIAMIDERLDVAVSPKRIAECKTVNDLVQLLGDKISG